MPNPRLSPQRSLGIAALLASFFLAACGGGGGGGGTVYTGPTTPATFTVANYKAIYDTVWDSTQVAEEGGFHKGTNIPSTAPGGLFSQLQRLINDATSPDPILGKITNLVTNAGALGGSRTVVFNILDQVDGTGAPVLDGNGNPIGVGTILVTYNNYNDHGVTLNGRMLVDVSAYDQGAGHLKTGVATLTNLSATSPGRDYLLNGTVAANTFAVAEALAFNLDGRGNGTSFRMENLFWTSVYAPNATTPLQCRTAFSLNGTIMVAPYGAMVAKTVDSTGAPTDLLYGPTSCVAPHPTQGGPLVLTGADGTNGPATISMTPLDATQLHLAVDVDGDGTPEQQGNQPWGAF